MVIHYQDRDIQQWPEWPAYIYSPNQIPPDATRALLAREKKSHDGIHEHRQLTMLKAREVNQDFLNQICELPNLEYVELDTVTAESLDNLEQLARLKTLKIKSLRTKIDLHPIVMKPSLVKFFIENAKHIQQCDFVADAHHLVSFGIEGSKWTKQKIQSLAPIRGLANLEALFLTAVQLVDKEIHYLSECPKLRLLNCARFTGKQQFQELRTLMPALECRWCDQYEISRK